MLTTLPGGLAIDISGLMPAAYAQATVPPAGTLVIPHGPLPVVNARPWLPPVEGGEVTT